MKKNLLPIAAVLTCTSLIITGCIKSNEYLLRLDDIGKFCKMKTFMFGGPTISDTVVFHYNFLGDPDSATWPQRTPHTNFYFTYDNHRRLLDFIGAYPGRATGVFWERFFYASDKSPNPSFDTLFAYPNNFIHWPPTIANYFVRDEFQYDSLGRITYTQGVNYVYDARGDLVLTGPQFNGPDDKVNYSRTSRIFQFLNKDYAVNNVFLANKYNRHGLPTDITLPFYGEGSEGFLGIPYAIAKIEYDCK